MTTKLKKSPQLNTLVEESWQSVFCSSDWCCVFNGKNSIGTINASTKEELFNKIEEQMNKEQTKIRGIYHLKQPVSFEISEPISTKLLCIN